MLATRAYEETTAGSSVRSVLSPRSPRSPWNDKELCLDHREAVLDLGNWGLIVLVHNWDWLPEV